LIDYKRRRRFAEALERILGYRPGPAERRRHTREYFMRTRCDKLFYLIFDRIRRDEAVALLAIENQDKVDAALARGNGVYLAMSHHGAYHVLSMLLALKGYRLVGVRDRNESSLRRYIRDRFERRYPDFRQMRVLYSDSYPREIFRCYKEGYVVGSAMDVAQVRDARKRTETVTIFGEEREFLSGPMRVAIRCGAPVLQGFVEPEGGFRYRLDIVDTLVDPEEVKDENATVSRAMKVYAANVEKYLRAAPSLVSRI